MLQLHTDSFRQRHRVRLCCIISILSFVDGKDDVRLCFVLPSLQVVDSSTHVRSYTRRVRRFRLLDIRLCTRNVRFEFAQLRRDVLVVLRDNMFLPLRNNALFPLGDNIGREGRNHAINPNWNNALLPLRDNTSGPLCLRTKDNGTSNLGNAVHIWRDRGVRKRSLYWWDDVRVENDTFVLR